MESTPSISGRFSESEGRITSQCTGPGLAMLAPICDRDVCRSEDLL